MYIQSKVGVEGRFIKQSLDIAKRKHITIGTKVHVPAQASICPTACEVVSGVPS